MGLASDPIPFSGSGAVGPARPVWGQTVGGVDFPSVVIHKIQPGSGSVVPVKFKSYDFDNFTMDAGINITLHFTQETGRQRTLADGNLQQPFRGFRAHVVIPWRALKQLRSDFDAFLVDLHEADKIVVIPHKDHAWNKFHMVVVHGWEYQYWLNKPYLGWHGKLELIGVERLSTLPLDASR